MAVDLKSFPEPELNPRVNPKGSYQGARAVIVSAARTPIGKFLGGLSEISAPDLGALAVAEALRRASIDPGLVDEVIMGCVLTGGLGQNPGRQAALGAGLPSRVSAFSLNQVCASGLKAVALAAQSIMSGQQRAVIAGGMESMSRSPYLLERARTGYRLGHGQLIDSMIADGLWDAYNDFHMGITGELVSLRYGLSRAEQDDYACESHQKSLAAQAAGRFKDEIVTVEVPAGKGQTRRIESDESPRADTSLESLARLRPAFDKDGSVTAGNAPGCNDGAAALLVMSADLAKELGLKPLATILDFYAGGLDPAWVMLTPVPSVRGLLARNPKWKIEDFHRFEVNEAFSVQALAVCRELGLPADRVNVNGGAVALGHPIGASGARILVTLIHALQQRGGGRGIATLCLGGGNGLALAVEV